MLLIRFFLRLYNLYLSPDKAFTARIRDLTGFIPARLAIFRLAFSHKSSQGRNATDDGPAPTNNERLEYLGDAVLGTIVAEYLFKKYPNGNEGFLTKMRSKIVNRNSLNRIGDEMGLDVLLTEYNRTRLSSSMLGNAVEALVGAVYLEKGYGPTKRFVIRRMLRDYVDMDHLESVDDNYKSQLLEYCQKNGKAIQYQIVSKYKQERRDRFKIGVVIGGETVATADDFNKKAAEQLASQRALVTLGYLQPSGERVGEVPALALPKGKREGTARRATGTADASAVEATPRRKKGRRNATITEDAPVTDAAATSTSTSATSARVIDNGASIGAGDAAAPHEPARPRDRRKPRRDRDPLTRAVEHASQVAAAIVLCTEIVQAAPAVAAATEAALPRAIEPRARRARRRGRDPQTRLLTHASHVAAAVVGLLDGPATGRPTEAPLARPDKPAEQESQAPARELPATIAAARPEPAVEPSNESRGSRRPDRRRRGIPARALQGLVADVAAAVSVCSAQVRLTGGATPAAAVLEESTDWEDIEFELDTAQLPAHESPEPHPRTDRQPEVEDQAAELRAHEAPAAPAAEELDWEDIAFEYVLGETFGLAVGGADPPSDSAPTVEAPDDSTAPRRARRRRPSRRDAGVPATTEDAEPG